MFVKHAAAVGWSWPASLLRGIGNVARQHQNGRGSLLPTREDTDGVLQPPHRPLMSSRVDQKTERVEGVVDITDQRCQALVLTMRRNHLTALLACAPALACA